MRKKVNEGSERRRDAAREAAQHKKEERKQSSNGREGISLNERKEITGTGRNQCKAEAGENWAAGVWVRMS